MSGRTALFIAGKLSPVRKVMGMWHTEIGREATETNVTALLLLWGKDVKLRADWPATGRATARSGGSTEEDGPDDSPASQQELRVQNQSQGKMVEDSLQDDLREKNGLQVTNCGFQQGRQESPATWWTRDITKKTREVSAWCRPATWRCRPLPPARTTQSMPHTRGRSLRLGGVFSENRARIFKWVIYNLNRIKS